MDFSDTERAHIEQILNQTLKGNLKKAFPTELSSDVWVTEEKLDLQDISVYDKGHEVEVTTRTRVHFKRVEVKTAFASTAPTPGWSLEYGFNYELDRWTALLQVSAAYSNNIRVIGLSMLLTAFVTVWAPVILYYVVQVKGGDPGAFPAVWGFCAMLLIMPVHRVVTAIYHRQSPRKEYLETLPERIRETIEQTMEEVGLPEFELVPLSDGTKDGVAVTAGFEFARR